jgi:hypothetical protein
MAIVWKSPDEISSFVLTLAEKNHYPRLENATFAVAFDDSKPFVKNKFNWGKVSRFSNFNRIWQADKFDFSIVLSSEVWVDVLNVEQREALLDLHLSSCVVEYVPQTVQEGKKKKVVKDDWGRIQYTDEIKLDDNSTPKWYVTPLDFSAFAQNVSRYGLWCTDFCEIQDLVPKNQ